FEALVGISLEKIVERSLILACFYKANTFRRPALKDMDAHPAGPIEYLLRNLAHCFEALKLEGEPRRHFRAARPLFFLGRRQQQFGFQKSKPRRHDQVVGSEIKLHPPRLRDEVEILLGKL